MLTDSRMLSTAQFFCVTNRNACAGTMFERPSDYRAFLRVLELGLTRHPVRLIAFNLLANHWHLVVGPVGKQSLWRLLHWVTATHTSCRETARRGEPSQMYQPPAVSALADPFANLMRVCRTVERRALTAGVVQRAQDWPWSSLSERLSPSSQLPLVFTPFLTSRAWIDFVNGPGAKRAAYERHRRPAHGTCPPRSRDLAEPPRRFA